MSDSREVFYENPRRFMMWFVYLLIIIIVVLIIWMNIGEIDNYIKVYGEVRPSDTERTISSIHSGRILESNLYDGKQVQSGDLLFKLDMQSQMDMLELMQNQYNNLIIEIRNNELLKESIIRGVNLLNQTNVDESGYYFQFLRYLTDVEVTLEQKSSINLVVDEELFREKARLDMLAMISNNLFSLKQSRSNLQMEIISIQAVIDESFVFAPINGVLSQLKEVNVGDFIQAGTDIVAIIPTVSCDLQIVLALPSENIAKIEVGQYINYRFTAFSFREFGETTGRITKISTDVHHDNMGNSFYMVEASLDNNTLEGRRSEIGQIRVGMKTEARILTGTGKILYWVLDKLNF